MSPSLLLGLFIGHFPLHIPHPSTVVAPFAVAADLGREAGLGSELDTISLLLQHQPFLDSSASSETSQPTATQASENLQRSLWEAIHSVDIEENSLSPINQVNNPPIFLESKTITLITRTISALAFTATLFATSSAFALTPFQAATLPYRGQLDGISGYQTLNSDIMLQRSHPKRTRARSQQPPAKFRHPRPGPRASAFGKLN